MKGMPIDTRELSAVRSAAVHVCDEGGGNKGSGGR